MTFEDALEKMRRYCGYQERCLEDLRQKAKKIDLSEDDLRRMIPMLESEQFYNEARFAIHYAGGKFRIKKWGKIKIRLNLIKKKVPPMLIDEAIAQIPSHDYRQTIREVLQKKMNEYAGDSHKIYPKIRRFAHQKGYEHELVKDIWNTYLVHLLSKTDL